MTDNIIYQTRDVCVNYWAHLDEIDIFYYYENIENIKGIPFDFFKSDDWAYIPEEDYKTIIKKINKIRLTENIDNF